MIFTLKIRPLEYSYNGLTSYFITISVFSVSNKYVKGGHRINNTKVSGINDIQRLLQIMESSSYSFHILSHCLIHITLICISSTKRNPNQYRYLTQLKCI